MIGWQWHQLDHMQVICTSLQTNNHLGVMNASMLFVCSVLFDECCGVICIATRQSDGRLNCIRQVAPMCPPMMAH